MIECHHGSFPRDCPTCGPRLAAAAGLDVAARQRRALEREENVRERQARSAQAVLRQADNALPPFWIACPYPCGYGEWRTIHVLLHMYQHHGVNAFQAERDLAESLIGKVTESDVPQAEPWCGTAEKGSSQVSESARVPSDNMPSGSTDH